MSNKAEKSEKVEIAAEARAFLKVAEVLEGMPRESAMRVLVMTCIIFEKYEEAMPIVQALADGQIGPTEEQPTGDDA